MIKLKSYAKINLTLDIIGKRTDGYHEIETIMQAISLADEILLDKTKEGIECLCNYPGIPEGKENLAYKAAKILLNGKKLGVKININKSIPPAAGLGGGSSNAAAVLIGVNKLFNLNYKIEELAGFASKIGSDVPFFLYTGTSFATGRGEKITPLPFLKDIWFVLIKPSIDISTKWAYQQVKPKTKDQTRSNKMLQFIQNEVSFSIPQNTSNNTAKKIAQLIGNDFEIIIDYTHEWMKSLKTKLLSLGLLGVSFSGSGPSIFGIAPDENSAKKVNEIMKNEGYQSWAVTTKPAAIEIF